MEPVTGFVVLLYMYRDHFTLLARLTMLFHVVLWHRLNLTMT